MTARGPITTHVLDTSTGLPAAGIPCILERRIGKELTLLAERTTDADGRVGDFLPPGKAEAGDYRLTFVVEPYFALQAKAPFYRTVQIDFVLSETDRHHHVPLLLSPFGYSTYRGS